MGPGQEAEELPEATVERVELVFLAEVPLADQPRGVAGGFQPLGEGDLAGGQPLAGTALGEQGRVEFMAVTLLVTAGEKRCPRRATVRPGDVTAGTADAVGADGVDVGGGHLPATVQADVRIAEVV